MSRTRFVLAIRPRDADAPGTYDLTLDIPKLLREFRGEQCVDRLCRKMDLTRREVLTTFTPGASLDPTSGEISLNGGYDPAFDEGALETLIWDLVSREVGRVLIRNVSRSRLPGSDLNLDRDRTA